LLIVGYGRNNHLLLIVSHSVNPESCLNALVMGYCLNVILANLPYLSILCQADYMLLCFLCN